MTQKGQFLLADSFSHKNPWQHKIQNRYAVVEAACGHSQKRDVSKVGHQKHGTGKGGRPIGKFTGPCQANPMPGYIVRIHTHAPAQKEQITATFQKRTYRLADDLSIIRGEHHFNHFGTQTFDLLRKDGSEPIFNETVINLIARDH
jgi:hypothetical protein